MQAKPLLTVLLCAALGCRGAQDRVVLYSAQDQDFARAVLPDFEKQTGLAVAAHFDTEATKSVGLYTQLVDEAGRPRCDVFWNNEILSTIRLRRQGLLEPYDSPAAAPFPAFAKAPDHTWHAFAARARILIVNTQLVAEADRPTSLLELTQPKWMGKVAIAKPLFGTTATQAACLFQVLGRERARDFYRGLKANGVHVVSGNKQVAEGVGAGQFAVGLTDTDDAIIEVEAGRPVAILFPDQQDLGTLFIPNTVMIIKGGPNPAGARQLVDFLLGAAVEQRLAESASRQIPLNPQVEAQLPKEIHTPRTVKAMAVDFEQAADRWEEAQEFLRKEFTAP
jgi:iron(III) transport system substrate-binding protein